MATRSLLERLDRIPPCLCRILARSHNGNRSLSHHELAARSGLSRSYVGTLSGKDTWANESVWVVEAFSRACGVDLFNPHEVRHYFATKQRTHINRAKGHRKKLFLRLFKTMNAKAARTSPPSGSSTLAGGSSSLPSTP